MALEGLLAWIEAQLLPCLTLTRTHHSRPRRLLTSNDCTLLSDPDADALSQSVYASDTSVFNQPDISADSRHFVTVLIKVNFCIGILLAVNFNY